MNSLFQFVGFIVLLPIMIGITLLIGMVCINVGFHIINAITKPFMNKRKK